MLNFLNIEKQAAKRVRNFLLHTATTENMELSRLWVVINQKSAGLGIHLHDGPKYLRTIPVKAVTDFFGKEVHPEISSSVSTYLLKLAEENGMEIAKLNVIIRAVKESVGVFIYEEGKYKKEIPTLVLLNQFNTGN